MAEVTLTAGERVNRLETGQLLRFVAELEARACNHPGPLADKFDLYTALQYTRSHGTLANQRYWAMMAARDAGAIASKVSLEAAVAEMHSQLTCLDELEQVSADSLPAT